MSNLELKNERAEHEKLSKPKSESAVPSVTPSLPEQEEEDFKPFDPLAEIGVEDEAGASKHYIHIRIQQRNGRKTLTTVQGIPGHFKFKEMLSALKKEFACNGTVIEDEELGKVLQLTGDQRTKVAAWLEEQEIAKKDEIKKHGF